ncbi:hypothetical protein [Actinokineospora sp. NBRC 105648]|uniref:hypothetical protein n=1 Tax=Actinokineospora sp. NBRC 105648 TaxID=3032206 RepID=UPI0024A5CED4|nr:hypothetical protein [Actinokineospora sp. NBRC 105648]GLZ38463.1 hypothetical protein Acsp05_20870 [Actinokineospora sp. NBRC 105648]
MNEHPPEEEDDDDVPGQLQTICPYCGGGGMVADPKHAIIGDSPRTIDNGRSCPHCKTVGHFPDIIPPV